MDQDTKKYLDEKFALMATKDDLSPFATKADLSPFATKTDIAELGEAVSALATHIDERFDELSPTINQVENHEKRLQFLEDRLPKLVT